MAWNAVEEFPLEFFTSANGDCFSLGGEKNEIVIF